MNSLEVRLNTLTPIWTGGIKTGTMDRIHETGIIGSLRWWMEVLVRGLDGKANDPTRVNRSGFDQKKYDESNEINNRIRLRNAGLCDVSQIFGATGWRRQFRLDIQDSASPDNSVAATIEAQRSYTDGYGNTKIPTWHFPNGLKDKPRSGQLVVRIQSLQPDFKPEIIAGLIQFIADWTAIGARPQMGFGVVQVMGERVDTQPLYDWLIAAAGSDHSPNYTLPSLQNIFLARIKPKESTSNFLEKDTFNLKYDLRRLFSDKKLRHFIMGTIKDGRIAAKIKMSRPYGDSLMHVWGWIPKEADVYTDRWNRDQIADSIYQHMKTNYTLQVWREMNSSRDTVSPNNNNVRAFLSSMLGLKEEDNAA